MEHRHPPEEVQTERPYRNSRKAPIQKLEQIHHLVAVEEAQQVVAKAAPPAEPAQQRVAVEPQHLLHQVQSKDPSL